MADACAKLQCNEPVHVARCLLQLRERTDDTEGQYALPTAFASSMSLSSSHMNAQSAMLAPKRWAKYAAACALPLDSG